MSDSEFDNIEKLPIWKEKYSKLGVTPRELYMRQNGLCWLEHKVSANGDIVLFCTDGKEKAVTDRMLNPTLECIQCITNYTKKALQEKSERDKQVKR